LARSVSGGRREHAFLTSREECRAFAAGEKSRRSRCGKAIEAFWPPLGPDQPFEVALDANHDELTETTMAAGKLQHKDAA
jgi:hypothetical protein